MESESITDPMNEKNNASVTQVILKKDIEYIDDLETKLSNWLRGMNIYSNVYSNIDLIESVTSD